MPLFNFRSNDRRAAEAKSAAPEEQEDGEVEEAAAGAAASASAEAQPAGKHNLSNTPMAVLFTPAITCIVHDTLPV